MPIISGIEIDEDCRPRKNNATCTSFKKRWSLKTNYILKQLNLYWNYQQQHHKLCKFSWWTQNWISQLIFGSIKAKSNSRLDWPSHHRAYFICKFCKHKSIKTWKTFAIFWIKIVKFKEQTKNLIGLVRCKLGISIHY